MRTLVSTREQAKLQDAAEKEGQSFSSWSRYVLVGLATGEFVLATPADPEEEGDARA
jgi:hypothetical protein